MGKLVRPGFHGGIRSVIQGIHRPPKTEDCVRASAAIGARYHGMFLHLMKNESLGSSGRPSLHNCVSK